MTTYAINNLIGAPVIHRTDWQGRQLLYPTPRTNLCSTILNGPASILSISTAIQPPSSIVGDIILSSIPASPSDSNAGFSPFNVATGDSIESYIWFYFPAGYTGGDLIIDYEGSASIVSTPETIVPSALDAWLRSPMLSGSVSAGGSTDLVIRYKNFSTSAEQIYFLQPQIYVGPAGAFIPSAFGLNIPGSTGTLTDYTLEGTAVNLGQVPAAGAILDWSGTGTYAS